MFEARIFGGRNGLAPGGIDHCDPRRQGSDASGGALRDGVLCGEKRASLSGSRSSGDNELMRGKAWTLVGLEHAVAEGVLLG